MQETRVRQMQPIDVLTTVININYKLPCYRKDHRTSSGFTGITNVLVEWIRLLLSVDLAIYRKTDCKSASPVFRSGPKWAPSEDHDIRQAVVFPLQRACGLLPHQRD